ncbi:hypothetical protein STIAU_5721 [Stigmatella aurantiaca DW4/3-1]|uniref:Uncharacterized protein n=1 Tax=Stigmatella aurantiaca (strain DW4/3-1) TaxID=378806 RepID=Q08ZC4_STIAD|nr:hypothetical protein STIAU_5721 [Stigmatella aurantiaca DW4/3-1]
MDYSAAFFRGDAKPTYSVLIYREGVLQGLHGGHCQRRGRGSLRA